MNRMDCSPSNPEPQLGVDASLDVTELLNQTVSKVSITGVASGSASAYSLPEGAQESPTSVPLETVEPVLMAESNQTERNDSNVEDVERHNRLSLLKAQLLCALIEENTTRVRQVCQMILIHDPSNSIIAAFLDALRCQPHANYTCGDNEEDSEDEDETDEDETDEDETDEDETDEDDGEDSEEEDEDDSNEDVDDESIKDSAGDSKDNESHRQNSGEDDQDVEDENVDKEDGGESSHILSQSEIDQEKEEAP